MARIWNKFIPLDNFISNGAGKQLNPHTKDFGVGAGTPLKRKVFVGMSGGVDSSVSAALLLKDGYDVTGVFIKTWSPDWLPLRRQGYAGQACTWREERLDAMRVAARLKIPLITLDLEKEYKRDVADYMIAEYRAGNVPNPDVMCNKTIKFGAFFDFAMSHGADFVATGHYAEVAGEEAKKGLSLVANPPHTPRADKDYPFLVDISGRGKQLDRLALGKGGGFAAASNCLPLTTQLTVSADQEKDQTYFLWTLGQKELSRALFPIGHLQKAEVRRLAKRFNLPVADKKDSQGLCFMGKVNVKDFLKHYIKEKSGDVLNEQGEVIGRHNGTTFFALGERHGFTINKKTPDDKPYYIVAKDIKKNILIVSNNKNKGEILKKEILLKNVNWNQGVAPTHLGTKCPSKLDARIRYRQELQKCRIEDLGTGHGGDLPRQGGGSYKVIFDKGQIAPSPGQSVVFYSKNICLGGGVIV